MQGFKGNATDSSSNFLKIILKGHKLMALSFQLAAKLYDVKCHVVMQSSLRSRSRKKVTVGKNHDNVYYYTRFSGLCWHAVISPALPAAPHSGLNWRLRPVNLREKCLVTRMVIFYGLVFFFSLEALQATMSICLPSLNWRKWNGFCIS